MLESFFPSGEHPVMMHQLYDRVYAAVSGSAFSIYRKILFDRLLFAPPFLAVFFVFVNLLQVNTSMRHASFNTTQCHVTTGAVVA